MNEQRNSQWRVAARPVGNVKPSDFECAEEAIPEVTEGQFLLRALYLGLRPVMRMYMGGAHDALKEIFPCQIQLFASSAPTSWSQTWSVPWLFIVTFWE
ncbi:MAG: hypothetical protein KDI16_03255 [Halioglobus sp.]|nr:hypothetical protein [Halioglobus sp.]